jgi:hypothetical protein
MKEAETGFPPDLIECRENPRYFLKLPIDYRRVGSSKFGPGHTVNFCDGGLKIAGVERIETGAEIEIKIYFGSNGDLVVIPAIVKVVWTDMEADETGFVRFGVGFLKISSKDFGVLKTLLKNYADPGTQRDLNPHTTTGVS